MDEPDSLYTMSPEYQVFQEMFSTLRVGIQAGLLELASDAFSSKLILYGTKTEVENSILSPSHRANIFLNAVLEGIETRLEIFDLFVAVLDSHFSHLAQEMRDKIALQHNNVAEKMEERLSVPIYGSTSRMALPQSEDNPSPRHSANRRVDSGDNALVEYTHRQFTPNRFYDQASDPTLEEKSSTLPSSLSLLSCQGPSTSATFVGGDKLFTTSSSDRDDSVPVAISISKCESVLNATESAPILPISSESATSACVSTSEPLDATRLEGPVQAEGERQKSKHSVLINSPTPLSFGQSRPNRQRAGSLSNVKLQTESVNSCGYHSVPSSPQTKRASIAQESKRTGEHTEKFVSSNLNRSKQTELAEHQSKADLVACESKASTEQCVCSNCPFRSKVNELELTLLRMENIIRICKSENEYLEKQLTYSTLQTSQQRHFYIHQKKQLMEMISQKPFSL